MSYESNRALVRQITHTYSRRHDRLAAFDWKNLTGYPGADHCLLTIEAALSNALYPVISGNDEYENPLFEPALAWLRTQAENPLVHAVMLHWISFSPDVKKAVWQMLYEVRGSFAEKYAQRFLSDGDTETFLPLTACLKQAGVSGKWSAVPAKNTARYVDTFWRVFRNWKQPLPFGRFASIVALNENDPYLSDKLLRTAIWQSDQAYLQVLATSFDAYAEAAVTVLLQSRVIEDGYYRNGGSKADEADYARNLFALAHDTADYLGSDGDKEGKKAALARRLLEEGHKPWIWDIGPQLLALHPEKAVTSRFIENWKSEEENARTKYYWYLGGTDSEDVVRNRDIPTITETIATLPARQQGALIAHNGLGEQWLRRLSRDESTATRADRRIALALIVQGKLDAKGFLAVAPLWSDQNQKRLTRLWLSHAERQSLSKDEETRDLAHRLRKYGLAAGNLIQENPWNYAYLRAYGYPLCAERDISPESAAKFFDRAGGSVLLEPGTAAVLLSPAMGEELLVGTILPSLLKLVLSKEQPEQFFLDMFQPHFEAEPILQKLLFRAALSSHPDAKSVLFLANGTFWHGYSSPNELRGMIGEYVAENAERLIRHDPKLYAALAPDVAVRRTAFFKHAKDRHGTPGNYDDLFAGPEDRRALSAWLLRNRDDEESFVAWVRHFNLLEVGVIKPSHLADILCDRHQLDLFDTILDMLEPKAAPA